MKPHDASKGVNLKEHVFSRAFVALPTHEKLLELSADVAPAYDAIGGPRETDTRYLAALTQWEQTRAFEVKYLNNGNTKSFPVYQAASLNEQVAMLAERADVFYSKHLEDHHESASERPSGEQPGRQSTRNSRGAMSGRKRGFGDIDTDDGRLRSDGRLHGFDWTVGIGTRANARIDARFPRGAGSRNTGGLPADTWRGIPGGPRGAAPERRQHGALPDSQGASSPAINRMRGMSGVPVDRFAPRRAALVPDHARRQLFCPVGDNYLGRLVSAEAA